MKFDEAMKLYGSDKPDTRFDLKLSDLNDIFEKTEFNAFQKILEKKGSIRAINLKHFGTLPASAMTTIEELGTNMKKVAVLSLFIFNF